MKQVSEKSKYYTFNGILSAVFFAILLLVGACAPNKKESQNDVVAGPTKPNIIFIMADDLGYADIGPYGQKIVATPHIDQLAKEGMRFTQCYSGSSVCAPARSVLMTGKHTGHTTVRGNFGEGGVKGLGGGQGRVPLKAEDVTVAEVLQQAGYVTGMVGKWGLGEPNTTGEPNEQGFDEFYGFLNQRRAHSYYPDYIWKNKEKVMLNNKDGKGTDYTHDLFANYAVDFINRHKDEPFFLYVPFCVPHDEYEIPDLGEYENRDWGIDQKTYAAMISRMDKSVGRMMMALEEAGIEDNTLVFFTSDNGATNSSPGWEIFESNGPLGGIKRDPYEGGIRVPMIVKYPGVAPAGGVSEVPWYFADVLPTLADLIGGNLPEGVDGISVMSAIKGENQSMENRYMYWEFYEKKGWRVARVGDWKAIQQNMNSSEPKPIELYNLKDDIGESKDLAVANPEMVKRAAEIFEEAHVPSEHFVWKDLQKQ